MEYSKRLAFFGIVSAILAAGSFFAADYIRGKEEERARITNERARLTIEAHKRQASVSQEAWRKIREARTAGEWQLVLKEEVKRLSGEEGRAAESFVKAKLFERYFWEAEQLLGNARTLLTEDKNHPTAQAYLKRAKEIYQKMDDLAPALGEKPGDTAWNKRINYLKGKFYFRSLFFVENPEEEQAKVLDLITRSAISLSKAFQSAPKDNDTEVALEVLQKKTKNMLSSGAGDDKNKLRLELLPAPSQEIDPKFGIDSGEGGKH